MQYIYPVNAKTDLARNLTASFLQTVFVPKAHQQCLQKPFPHSNDPKRDKPWTDCQSTRKLPSHRSNHLPSQQLHPQCRRGLPQVPDRIFHLWQVDCFEHVVENGWLNKTSLAINTHTLAANHKVSAFFACFDERHDAVGLLLINDCTHFGCRVQWITGLRGFRPSYQSRN